MKAADVIGPSLIVLVLGFWLSAESSGSQALDADRCWPLLILAAGLCFLTGYFLGSRPWQLFLGFLASLSGLLLWPLASGFWPWETLTRIWPAFLVIAGCAVLAYIAASPTAPWPLFVPALSSIAVGCLALLLPLGILAANPIDIALRLWPLLLLAMGLLGLLQALWHTFTV